MTEYYMKNLKKNLDNEYSKESNSIELIENLTEHKLLEKIYLSMLTQNESTDTIKNWVKAFGIVLAIGLVFYLFNLLSL